MTTEILSGLDELDSNIDRLVSEVQESSPSIVLESAAIIEGEVRRLTPVRSGALAEHLDSKLVNGAMAVVQIEDSAPKGSEEYAVSLEFGTSKQPAKPFFRPGAAIGIPKAREHAIGEISRIILKNN